jgi:hypothetical protein
MFYLIDFTSYTSSSSSKHSLSRCFLVQRRHQQLGRVKCDDLAKQYVFPCQLLIVVVPLLFYLVHFTSRLCSSFSQTQQPFKMLPRSTSTSATGSCQVWRPCITVRLALPIVDSCVPLLFCYVHFTSSLLFFLLENI